MATITSMGLAAYQDPMFGFQGKISSELKYRNWREAAVYMQIDGERYYTYITEREIPGDQKGEWQRVYSVMSYSGSEMLREQTRDFKKLKDAFIYVNAKLEASKPQRSKIASERRSPLVIFSGHRKG